MTSKISILTTCTITLATALTNLTSLEARAMEGESFTTQEKVFTQATSTSNNTFGICIWVPGYGWVGNCPWLQSNDSDN